jgi:hypothetical protein
MKCLQVLLRSIETLAPGLCPRRLLGIICSRVRRCLVMLLFSVSIQCPAVQCQHALIALRKPDIQRLWTTYDSPPRRPYKWGVPATSFGPHHLPNRGPSPNNLNLAYPSYKYYNASAVSSRLVPRRYCTVPGWLLDGFVCRLSVGSEPGFICLAVDGMMTACKQEGRSEHANLHSPSAGGEIIY